MQSTDPVSQETETQNPASAAPQTDETLEASETSNATDGELQATEGEDQADAQGQDADASKAKKPSFVKRIDKLTRRNGDLSRELEYWKEQAMRGQGSKPDESARETQTQNQSLEAKPSPDAYESHEAYVEALAEWKVEQKLKARDEKAKAESAKSEFQKQIESYKAKAEAFARENPDFVDAVEDVADVRLSMTVEQAILKHGPELAYELAKNPDELKRICSLHALDAAEEIGEIRARMKSAKAEKQEPTKPQLTQAPKPPTPIASKSTTVRRSIHDDDLPFAEYERLRREQMRKRG